MSICNLYENAYEPALFDDVDVTVTAAKFDYHEFPATERNPEGSKVVALLINLQTDDGTDHSQIYTVGNPEQFIPSEDGQNVEPASDAIKGFSKRSAVQDFLDELKNAGFPLAKLDELGAGKALVNMKGHVVAKPLKDAKGEVITRKSAKNGREYPQTRIVFNKIHSLPWEKGKGTKAAKSTAKATAPAETEASSNGDGSKLANEVGNFVLTTLAEAKGNKMTRQELYGTAVRLYLKDKRRKAITDLLNSPDFIKGIEGIEYDGATVALA